MLLPDGFDQLVPESRQKLVDCGVCSRPQALELVELLPTREPVELAD